VSKELIEKSEKRNADLFKSEIGSLKDTIIDRFEAIENKQIELQSELVQKTERIHQLEKAMKRNNIIAHGIPENGNETANDRNDAILRLCDKLKIAALDYTEAYRLGKPTTRKNRPLLIKCVRFRDKIAVLKAAADARIHGLSLGDDLTEEERKMRSALVTEKKKIKAKNPEYMCKIRGEKLIVQRGSFETVYKIDLETKILYEISALSQAQSRRHSTPIHSL